MGFFKFAPELFLEAQELNVLTKILDTQGFRKELLSNTYNFGIVKDRTTDFNNLRIVAGTITSPNPTFKLQAGMAIDKNGEFITVAADVDNNTIPAASTWYWVKIAWATTSVEQGTVSIDASGNVTGTGTTFTSVLRGLPNFPARIQFSNAAGTTPANYLQYDVLSITDDTHMTLNGASFTVETPLFFSVVGTFTPGISIPSGNQFPFQYDGYLMTLVQETTFNTPPTINANVEFLLARIEYVGTNITIQDKRTQIWQTYEDFKTNNLNTNWPTGINGIVGVEEMNWGTNESALDYSVVCMAWGFRSTNYTYNTNLNLITINGGQGGSYKSTSNFTTGDFDGGRIYLADGTFLRILTSVKSGTQINCYVQSITNVTYLAGYQILVTPDAEEIEIMFSDEPIYPPSGNPGATKSFFFPINVDVANCELRAYSSLYNVDYRFKTNYKYTPYITIANGSYTNEASETSTYVGEAGIQLLLNPLSYGFTYKGDRYGVGHANLASGTYLYNLTVGDSYQYTIFAQSIVTFGQDVLINLQAGSNPLLNGNRFVIWFQKWVAFSAGTIKIVTDYNATGPTYTTVYEFPAAEVAFINNSSNLFGVRKECVFDGTNWFVDTTNEYQFAVERPGTVVMFAGTPSGQFDGTTGLGLSTGNWYGWALANGQNSTADLREKFIVGYDPAVSAYNTVGNTGGEAAHTLTTLEIPVHSHGINWNNGTGSMGNSGAPVDVAVNDLGSGTAGVNGQAPQTIPQGGDEAHNNLPPYYVLAFVQKL